MAQKGVRTQAIGRSRGGQTTKIHALTDVLLTDLLGRPVALTLAGANVADIRMAETLLAHSQPMRRLIADRGYDANVLRKRLRDTGATPVIPGRRSRKRPIQYDERRDRWRIEVAFCRLKDFRRVATRYNKRAVNFLSAVCLAAVIAFWV